MRDARSIAEAIRTGRLKRQPCRDCGALKVDGHHPDYTKPLEVVWLCKKHHRAEHRRLQLAGIEIPGRETRVLGPEFSPEEFVGLPTGADMLDLTVVTLRRWLTEGRLTRYKAGGRTLVKTSELLDLVKAE